MRFALFVVIMIGLLLRWPIPEPTWVQVDERSFVEFTLGFFSGDLNPHFFNYPTLHFYLCSALDYIWYLVSDAESLESFVAYRWFVDGFDLIVIARGVSTIMAVATIAVTWRVGVRLYGQTAGLGAGLVLALMPLHVRFAHLASTDIPVTFWSSLAVLFAIRIVQEGRTKDCLWAGLVVGLAGATKYPGALMAVPVGLSVLLRWPTWRHPGLLISGTAALLTFALTSPYTWLDTEAFWAGLSHMGREHMLGNMHTDDSGFLPTVVRVNLRYGLGLAGLGLGVVALGWPLRWRRCELVLLAAIIANGTLVLAASSQFMRYCLPLAPLWSVLIWRVLCRLQNHRILQLICIALVLTEPAYASWNTRRLHGGFDTRTQAENWIRQHLPDGGRLAQMQGRPGQTRRLFTPVSVMTRLQPFERAFGEDRLVRAFEILAQRRDLPPLYTYFDLNALPTYTASSAQMTVDSTHVLEYSHPLRDSDDSSVLAAIEDRIDWLATFSPGDMPEAVFDQPDWHFVPIGGWSGAQGSGPLIRIGRVPLTFRRAIPSNLQFLQLLHDLQLGRHSSRRQDWERARSHLDRVMQGPYLLEELLSPSVRYDVLLKLGAAEYAVGSNENAVGRWLEALRLQPELPEPRYNLGLGFDALGRYSEAVTQYEYANRLQPDNADVLYSLAQSRSRLRRYDEAIDAYEQALALTPTAEGYVDLGLVLQMSGRQQQAQSAFRQALRLAPDMPRAAEIRERLHHRGI